MYWRSAPIDHTAKQHANQGRKSGVKFPSQGFTRSSWGSRSLGQMSDWAFGACSPFDFILGYHGHEGCKFVQNGRKPTSKVQNILHPLGFCFYSNIVRPLILPFDLTIWVDLRGNFFPIFSHHHFCWYLCNPPNYLVLWALTMGKLSKLFVSTSKHTLKGEYFVSYVTLAWCILPFSPGILFNLLSQWLAACTHGPQCSSLQFRSICQDRLVSHIHFP